MKINFLLPLFTFVSLFTYAQKNERKVGPYFQQEVKYEIEVTLDDVNHTLKGFEKITYINNSPYDLKYIWFHLWPNAYKNQKTALAKQLLEGGDVDYYFDNNAYNGYIDSLCFVIGEDTLEIEYKGDSIDICKLKLPTVLSSKDSVVITTPFFVKIPSGEYSRLGHIGQSYQITQWYPKPAVYDRDGWHEMPYLGQGEFYSEFGSFDVKITLPANYYVGHTGYLVNDFKETDALKKRAEETEKLFDAHVNKVGNIIDPLHDGFPASSTELKTLHIKQQRVHDFGWFADKRFYILRGEVELPHSKRKVKTMAMFTSGNSRYWKKSIDYINNALYYYSLWNGDYPYHYCTAVDGTISAGGGMEYPNVTVIGDVSSDLSLETVIMHEVGHNWFYGFMGTNEREHPWMDEGINSFNEMRYLRTLHPEANLLDEFIPGGLGGISRMLGLDKLKQQQQYYYAYLYSARKNKDQPIEYPAADYTPFNYGGIVYSKTAVAFDYLHDFLGEQLFNDCMQTYYEKWKFKHPQPGDLQVVFEQVSKQDLDWFFRDLIGTTDIVDYKIIKKKKVNAGSSATFGWMKYEETLVVKNKGDIIAPFTISGVKGDSTLYKFKYAGFKGKQEISFPNCECDKFVIDYEQHSTDYKRSNNTLYQRKLFKKLEPMRLQLFGSIEDQSRTLINYTPLVGGNVYDGFMAGVAVYSTIFPARNFEFTLAPMYSFRNNRPRGYAEFSYRFNDRKSTWLHSIKPGIKFASFGIQPIVFVGEQNSSPYSQFIKLAPELEIKFKNKKLRNPNENTIKYRFIYLEEEQELICNNCVTIGPNENITSTHEVSYNFKRKEALKYYQVNLTNRYGIDGNNNNFLLSMLEAKYHHVYNRQKNSVNIRLFAGTFFMNETNLGRYNLRMDGQRGYYDYLYDEVFPGRFETDGLWSRQFISSYGGFKVPTAVSQSSKWLAAMNIDVDLPIKFVKPFIDFGMGDSGAGATFIYDAGLMVPLFRGMANVYFPLLYSKEIKDELTLNSKKFKDIIRFNLNLSANNPLKLIRDL